MMDKITSLAVPPGNSLTDPPGKWPWEQPPRFTDPDEVIDFTIERIEKGPNKDDYIKMMLAGITVEEIVEQVTFKGFTAGAFTPDVAEIIKPALAIYFVDMAIKSGFEPDMFVENETVKDEMEDNTLMSIAKERNPVLYSAMIEEANRQERMEIEKLEDEDMVLVNMPEDKPTGSFLDTQTEGEQ